MGDDQLTAFASTDKWTVYNGDCLDVMRKMPDNSVDSIVTDPPYGLGTPPDPVEVMKAWCETGFHEVKSTKGFMGAEWDSFVPQPVIWKEAFRVLKPGGHLLAFAGTRTQDWMAMALRFAGFEIRDAISYLYSTNESARRLVETMSPEQAKLFEQAFGGDGRFGWSFGSGFPKSLSVGKAIDKEAGAEREGQSNNGIAGGTGKHTGQEGAYGVAGEFNITAPSTDAAKQWAGWGTALKPAWECLAVAQKRLNSSSVIVASLVSKLKETLCQSQLFAITAEKVLMSNLKEQKGVAGIAQWIAEKNINTQHVLSVLTDTLRSESEKNSSLNIVLSWLNTLEELCKATSTSTTSTELNTTTELKILLSMEWESILQSIIQAKDSPTSGLIASVYNAESIFNVLRLKLKTIQEPSVAESAIFSEEKLALRPSLSLITLSRKPLATGNTVAANVLEYGTGALNIDGCRVQPTGESKPRENETSQDRRYAENGGTNFAATPVIRGGDPSGRWPANLILAYPEDEYMLRDDVTRDQLHKLEDWINENTKR